MLTKIKELERFIDHISLFYSYNIESISLAGVCNTLEVLHMQTLPLRNDLFVH